MLGHQSHLLNITLSINVRLTDKLPTFHPMMNQNQSVSPPINVTQNTVSVSVKRVVIAGGRIFHGGQCNVTPTSRVGSIAVGCSSRAVMPLLHHSRDSQVPMLSTGLDNAQNCPFPWRILTHLIHGSLGPNESASQTASRLVQPFSHSSPIRSHTDRLMHRWCYVSK